MHKKGNIVTFLRLRQIGFIMPFFRNRIVILSRPPHIFDDCLE